MTWPRCFGGVSKLSKESFLFFHNPSHDFILTMWTNNALLYAVWSSICCLYSLTMVIYSGMGAGYGVKILIWLTYWAFYSLTLRFIVTATNCWYYYFFGGDVLNNNDVNVNQTSTSNGGTSNTTKQRLYIDLPQDIDDNVQIKSCQEEKTSTPESNQELPINLAFQWFLQNISNAVSLLVTALFWALVYTGDPQTYVSINSHVLNSLMVLSDVMISRAPIRIQHAHVPITFLGIYIFFTIIYWAAGGTNHLGRPHIYNILDYSTKPGTAAVAILLVALIAVPLTQLFLYGIYRLRVCLHLACRKQVIMQKKTKEIHLSDIVAHDMDGYSIKMRPGDK
ncbi:unnamed protein product [Lymnaea stagnalis]|uniref:Protein rolling stone n=1 Tax=Lymnaea stagnalis TaxID=6523 RepID=A0AAV2HCA3_LYMST